MQFTLKLDMSNDAFARHNPEFRDATEVARILRNLADKLDNLNTFSAYANGPLRDGNGNSVGSWDVTS